MTSPMKAVACLSGGLDSSVALWLARREGWDVCLALTFDYGQRASTREIRQAESLARSLAIPHRVVTLPWLRDFAHGGALLDQRTALPEPGMNQLSDSDFSKASAKAVWVPNRNGVMIEVAAGFAEDAEASAVIVGFNLEEAATFPDNSQAYMEKITEALSFSTSNRVRVISPTAVFSKTEIVAKAKAMNFPFQLLWSCYEAGEKMCGVCESCMRLKRALDRNEAIREVPFENASLS